MHKGFTLVELSIVLVIIGLLIGGILAAQSMIGTSKIVAMAGQIQQFDAGVMAFKSKYNALPGDSPQFGGDGDKIIDRTAASGDDNSMNVFQCEIANFWHSMDPSQFSYNACNGGGGPNAYTKGVNKNVPLSKLGKAGSFVIGSAISPGGVHADPLSPNYYVILDPSQPGFTDTPGFYGFMVTSATNSAVTPADSLALDKKIDDGIANNGNVLSGGINDVYSGDGAPTSTPISDCSTTTTYNLQNIGYVCTPLIRIGSQASDPQ